MSIHNSIQPLLRIKDIRRRFMLGETSIDALHSVSLDGGFKHQVQKAQRDAA